MARPASRYPVIAVQRQGVRVQEAECVPTDDLGVYLVADQLHLQDGDQVVVAFDGADLRRIYGADDVDRITARAGSVEDPLRQSDPSAVERLSEALAVSGPDLLAAIDRAGVVLHRIGEG